MPSSPPLSPSFYIVYILLYLEKPTVHVPPPVVLPVPPLRALPQSSIPPIAPAPSPLVSLAAVPSSLIYNSFFVVIYYVGIPIVSAPPPHVSLPVPSSLIYNSFFVVIYTNIKLCETFCIYHIR